MTPTVSITVIAAAPEIRFQIILLDYLSFFKEHWENYALPTYLRQLSRPLRHDALPDSETELRKIKFSLVRTRVRGRVSAF